MEQSKWLDSRLFEGGLLDSSSALNGEETTNQREQDDEELAWLLAGLRQGQISKSAEYYQFFVEKNKELADMFDQYGGETIDEAMRWFAATALRHLCLVNVARKKVLALDQNRHLQVFDLIWGDTEKNTIRREKVRGSVARSKELKKVGCTGKAAIRH